MPIEMALWKMTPAGPEPVKFAALDLEQRLEDMIVKDPSLLGLDLLVIDRQVQTDYGGVIDVLAVDSDAHVHVLELKRDKTPRDIVAQTLDYGSWAQSLTVDKVEAIYASHHQEAFAQAFAQRFGAALPDVFNPDQQLTIVASQLDPASERIVAYLADRFAVPVNAVFFRHFADGGSEYLARTWLLSPDQAETATTRAPRGQVRTWNGIDYYVILGNETEPNRWELGRKYCLLSAGGKPWYWKPLRNLAPGNRVFAYVGGAGYVGVGRVTGTMVKLRDFEASVDGQVTKVIEQHDVAADIRERALSADDDQTEYAVPVEWLETRPTNQAVSETGLFSSQVTVCKLRDERTIQVVTEAFGLQNT